MSCISHVPKRYWVTIFLFLGTLLMCLLRINMSIALIEMTSNKTIRDGNKTDVINADFNWNSREEGLVLGAFSIGCAFAFLSGFIVRRFGGARIIGINVTISAILVILIPFLVRIHFYVFIFDRVLLGLFAGFMPSASTDVFARWSPKNERTRLASFAFMGIPCSIAINYPLAGYVAYTLGWEAIFYLSGAASLVWGLIWLIFINNSPANDRFLKENTCDMIAQEKVKIPWRSILTSKPIYAIFNALFTMGFAPDFVGLYLPLYIKDVHDINILNVGLISGIPVLFGVITIPVAACIADYLRSNSFTNSKVHKIFIFWGETFVLVWIFIAALSGNFVVCIICFCLLQISFGFAMTSYIILPIDVAGQHAPIITAFSQSVYSLSSFLSPLALGLIVPNRTLFEWNLYFFFLSFVTIYGVVVFLIFGSGKLQPWATVSRKANVEIYPLNQNRAEVEINDNMMQKS